MRWPASPFRYARRRLVTALPDRAAHLIARWYMLAASLYITSETIVFYAGPHHRGTGVSAVGLLYGVGLLAVWWWVTAVDRRHLGSLCETCAVEFPLNPGARAEHYDRSLRVAHWPREHRAASLVILGAILAGMVITWPGDLAMVVVMVWLGFLLGVAQTRHDVLQIWCPYCKRPPGDFENEVPSPAPAPTGTVMA